MLTPHGSAVAAAFVAAVQATCADTNVGTAIAEKFTCPLGQMLVTDAASVFPPSENSCCTVSGHSQQGCKLCDPVDAAAADDNVS